MDDEERLFEFMYLRHAQKKGLIKIDKNVY